MELVREIFRLKWGEKRSKRLIGSSLHISKSTVATYLARAARAKIDTLEQLSSLSHDELKKIIFPEKFSDKKYDVDFSKVNTELKRKNMTLMLLWQEELENNPNLFNYSQFCYLYSQWSRDNKITMRQEYKAGERGFIDYAGTTLPIINHKNRGGTLIPDICYVFGSNPLYLCRGHLDSRGERLSIKSCSCLRVFWRCTRDTCPR